jgi:hypothetical protein
MAEGRHSAEAESRHVRSKKASVYFQKHRELILDQLKRQPSV